MNPATLGYQILSLTALSGELSPECLLNLNLSPSYLEKLITRLKEEKLIKTHYKDKLRGYRLTGKGKKLLSESEPGRYSFYLTGNSDTNRPRSDIPRRLRLHQTSKIYVLLLNADICFYRDKKPLLFQPGFQTSAKLPACPLFYQAKECKELGVEAIKINNSRFNGLILTQYTLYTVYYTGDFLMKWTYNTELRLKALLLVHMSQGILSEYLGADTPIHAIMIGKSMDTALKLLTSNGGSKKCYFYLDTSFESFHFIPDSKDGSLLLKLLCDKAVHDELTGLLLSDLETPVPEFGFYHDAVQNGSPVLLAFDFDMIKIKHFITALTLTDTKGTLICFDFQTDVLIKYVQDAADISSIDFSTVIRRFFSETKGTETT